MENIKGYNILHIPIWYPNKKHPGQGIFIKRHIQAISLQNNCCVLFLNSNTLNQTSIEVNKVNKNLCEIRVYFKKPFKGFFKFLNFFFYLNGLRLGLNEAKKELPTIDIIHHHIFDKKIIFSYLLARYKKTKFIFSEQWSGYYKQDGRFGSFFEIIIAKFILPKTQAITTVSNSLANAMKDWNINGNYFVVPNVVNVDEFKLKSNNKLNTDNIPRALHVSAINDKEKNISGMLRAVKKVIAKHPLFQLTIIGDHDEKQKLIEYSTSLGLENNVFFLGYVSPEKMLAEYHKANFFILFSHFETFSCVLAEALSVGIPVIATNAGGIPEFVNSANGILVESNNENELENAMENLILNFGQYIPENLSQSVFNYVNPISVGEKFQKIYSSI